MMLLDVENPVFQSVVAPFLTSLLLVGVSFTFAGRQRGAYVAVCGAAIGILVAYCLAFSWPLFPPRTASQKLGYLIAAACLLSLFFACRPTMSRTWRWLVLAFVLAGLAWIAQSKITQGQFGEVALVEVTAIAALVGLLWVGGKPIDKGVAALVAAFAIAGIAVLAPSASITQMALAAAAATGGYLLWTWPKPRLEFSEAGVVAIGAPLIWLGGQAALYSKASDPALALVAAIVLAPFIRGLVFHRLSLESDAIRPVFTGLIAAIVGVIAVGIALAGTTSDSGYAG